MNAIGNKARSLIEMQDLGLEVPAFFVIDTNHYMDYLNKGELCISPNVRELILAQLRQLGGTRWIVRSSSTKEDGSEYSFAGLFESFGDLQSENEVIEAVVKCWQSAFSDRVTTYCQRLHINPTHIQMAVIVQKYIDADFAGVMFTAHPTTGDDQEMLIEACRGSGEQLVSGLITPSRYRISWFGAAQVKSCEENDNVFFNSDRLTQLQKIGRQLQAHYGRPQDVEFAIAQNKIYVVQSRAITRMQYAPSIGEWTTADFRDGGVSSSVVSPLMWSLYDEVFSASMSEYFCNLKLLDPKTKNDIQWFKVFYGRPYWNLQAIKDIMLTLPDFNERNFDQDFSIPPTYDGAGRTSALTFKTLKRAIPVLFALKKEFKAQQQRSEDLLLNFSDIEEKYRDLNISNLGERDFAQHLEILLQDQFDVECEYFKTIYNASNAKLEFMSALKAYKKIRPQLEYIDLISNLGDSNSTEPATELHELAKRNRSHENIFALSQLMNRCQHISQNDLASLPEPMAGELKSFINKYYFHSERELDLRVPRWKEDAHFICTTLLSLLESNIVMSPEQLRDRKTKANDKAVKLLLEAHQNSWLSLIPGALQSNLTKLNRLRHFLWLREELRCLSTRMYFFIRQFALELARRKGLSSENASLIFYSNKFLILSLAKGEISVEAFSEAAQQYFEYAHGYLNFTNPNEIGFSFNQVPKAMGRSASNDSQTLQGIGCSGGRIRGRARVITDIRHAGQLKAGEILVTKFTDPGWTPLFSLAAGVICETGGLLSHAALISREYGIPSVLNVKDAMTSIKDNDEIEIDGTFGEVYLI